MIGRNWNSGWNAKTSDYCVKIMIDEFTAVTVDWFAWNPTAHQLAGWNSNFDKSRLAYDVTFYLSRKDVRKMFDHAIRDLLLSGKQNCWKQWS